MSSALGLYTVLSVFIPEDTAMKIALILPGTFLLFWLWAALTAKAAEDDVPPSLPKSGLFTAWPFFTTQFDFLAKGFTLTGQSIYQFQLLYCKVVVLSGEPARRDFFAARSLDLHEGFRLLSGAMPMQPGVTSEITVQRVHQMFKRLTALQNSDRLSRLVPHILDDTARIMQSWGTSGTINLFEDIHHLVFQTSVRCLASTELADDPAMVLRLKSLYDTIDSHATPASVLLPWLPSWGAIRRLWATKEIYDIVCSTINHRLRSGISRDDTLQLLLDNADHKMVSVGFIMGFLAAGARSTGTTASWLITFLSGDRHWRQQAAAEVRQLLFHTAAVAAACDSPPAPLSDLGTLLASIPLETWEGSTPVLDALIRETLRLAEPHNAMRKNTGPALKLGGKTVPTGAFVLYPFSDAHLSAELYPDPWRFDPARPESKMPCAYYICMGQRLAKVELKLITAMFVLGFDFCAVDRTGRALEALPRPDWNDTLTCKPPKDSCFLKFQRVPT
ncbi:cytochrome P450 [Amylocystis lapponica]|nr:cytochrome P450 [Amylocystis lapponica]